MNGELSWPTVIISLVALALSVGHWVDVYLFTRRERARRVGGRR